MEPLDLANRAAGFCPCLCLCWGWAARSCAVAKELEDVPVSLPPATFPTSLLPQGCGVSTSSIKWETALRMGCRWRSGEMGAVWKHFPAAKPRCSSPLAGNWAYTAAGEWETGRSSGGVCVQLPVMAGAQGKSPDTHTHFRCTAYAPGLHQTRARLFWPMAWKKVAGPSSKTTGTVQSPLKFMRIFPLTPGGFG